MLVHSSAKIIAEVQFDKSLSVDSLQLSKRYTGKEKNRYYLNILSEKIPLFIATKIKKDFDIVEENKPLYIFSKQLPFGIHKKTYRFYNKKNEALSQKQALEILRSKMKQYEALELKNSAIIHRDDEITMNNGVIKLTAHYTVEEEIGKKVPIVE